MDRMNKWSTKLEDMVAERTQQGPSFFYYLGPTVVLCLFYRILGDFYYPIN